jgi:hypothetical protein
MDNMSERTGMSDSRAVYTPPCVVRISDLKKGAGDCRTGSGDAGVCNTGNSATDLGCGTGNSAGGENCIGTGSSASPNCITGSSGIS